MTKRFKIQAIVTAEIEIETEVLDVATSAEWAADFYTFKKPQEVANHIAYNMIKGASLSDLDGFADRDNMDAKVYAVNWDFKR